MLDAMSFVLSSLARRLRLRRRRKRITSSAVTGRPPLFLCGCSGDVKATQLRKQLKGAFKPSGKRVVQHGSQDGSKVDADLDEPCVWRRTILLGRRCRPLEFHGAIHYDGVGQRLWQGPRTSPRLPPLGPAGSFEAGYMDRA